VIRVLIVDDSRAFRLILRRELTAIRGVEVVGEASDPFEARERIVALAPDVLTLDVNMPRMDGDEFLRHLMAAYPLPVVVITSEAQGDAPRVAALRAAGAAAVIAKPTSSDRELFSAQLAVAVQTAATARASTVTPSATEPRVIAIGASTGGATATVEVLNGIGARCPPIVIAQHIHPGLAGNYAAWLGQVAPMAVREARDGDALEPDLVLLPPSDRHLRVVRSGDKLRVQLGADEKVNGHRPSVDVMFSSLARLDGEGRIVAIVLTGMGIDGARGLYELRRRGARTIVEDPFDCVVPSMPEAAIKIGAAQTVLRLALIARAAMA
jgi:two-component system chemotaxis response regulator CheB